MTQNAGSVLLDLTAHEVEAVLNTLDACASDQREPQRYREWYAEVAAKVREQIATPNTRSEVSE